MPIWIVTVEGGTDMSVKNIIGVVLLCIIIGVPFGVVIHEIGLGEFLSFIGICLVIIAAIYGAVWCLIT